MTEQSPARAGSPLALPLGLLLIALLLMLSYQTYTLWQEREGLIRRYAKQEPALQQSHAMRGQLESIAQRTAELADQGNTHAARLVQTLQQRGITINRKKPGPDREKPFPE